MKLRTLTVSMGLRKSSWCTWHGQGCPSGGEMLLPLQQPQALHLQLPAGEILQSEYAVKPQGGDGTKEGSLDISHENDTAQEPPGGGSQGIT